MTGKRISDSFHGLYDTGEDTPALAAARTLPLACLDELPAAGYFLAEHDGRLCLCRGGDAIQRGLYVDLNSADVRRRITAGRRSPLARALGLHKRTGIRVLDATCGLGRDSAVLAGLGCSITAIERHAALYAVLADGLRRAERAAPAGRSNWQTPHHDDARAWLDRTDTADMFDAIYIDPMFDNNRRKASPRRALQWLGELVGPDDDAGSLLAAARGRALRRVVVKNHARAAPLAPPDHRISGKAMRFDIYFTASNDLR